MDRNFRNRAESALYRKVALRKESVDRNAPPGGDQLAAHRSLSARRAWIEISGSFPRHPCSFVALRKESVDRNASFALLMISALSRSPQGERG